jgi:hypothetical protein
MSKCQHIWVSIVRRSVHAYGRKVYYVRCMKCGAVGFRFFGRRVVYTWEGGDA